MSHQVKTIVVSIAINLLLLLYFSVRFSNMFAAGLFDGPDGSALLGQTILTLIGAGIVLNIVGHIGFSILHAIVTNTPKPSFIVDERDRAIERKGDRIGHFITGAGLILSMVLLATGTGPLPVIVVITFAFVIGDLIGNIAKLGIYGTGGA